MADELNVRSRATKENSILVLGLVFEANVDNVRVLKSYALLDMLNHIGAKVDYRDTFVPVIRLTREYTHRAGTRSIAWFRESVALFDVVFLATNNAAVNCQELLD
jgi:UDP-N-acetyl-D-glucosamine dehydrogenase